MENPTKIFRIETPNGKGICAATGSILCHIYNIACGEFSENEHCGLCKCALSKARKMENQTFAFPTLEALKTWFPKARGRKAMADAGAIGSIYQIDQNDIAKSPFQCVFDRKHSVKVGTFNLETLL